MNLVYAYPSETGDAVQAEILALLRERFGDARPVGCEQRDSLHGGGGDTIVTVEIGDAHMDAAVEALRSHPAVIEAAGESFGERV